jgi:hypothetical protein
MYFIISIFIFLTPIITCWWLNAWCGRSIYTHYRSLLYAKWRIKIRYNAESDRNEYYVQVKPFLIWYYLESWDELMPFKMFSSGDCRSEELAKQRIVKVKERLTKSYKTNKSDNYIEIN